MSNLYKQMPRHLLENAEKLEQLSLLLVGCCFKVFQVTATGPSGTPQCLKEVLQLVPEFSEEVELNLSNVKLVITDVDGVLTDGGIIYDEAGECMKRFHVRDGLGI